jgi:polysaccharide export outer membrane protein
MTAMRALSIRRPGLALGALLSLVPLAVACATPPVTPPPLGQPDAYRVGAPDQLRVKILPEPVIDDSIVVRPDGKITVELIGDVQAAGRTTDEIAREVEQRVKRYKRGAQATVSIVAAASSTVTVLGEVRRPGTIPLTKQTRIAEALGTSAGMTSFANLDAITVVRSSGKKVRVIPVDFAAIRAGDLSTNITVHGGDIIYVPPTAWAKVGYAIQAVLFPLQPLLGVANSVGGSLVADGL